MSLADRYLEVAERLDSKTSISPFGCVALSHYGVSAKEYIELFYPPEEFSEYHGPAWWNNGEDSEDEMRNNRVLALCFMAAIVRGRRGQA